MNGAKPPCVECARHVEYDSFYRDEVTVHWCRLDGRSGVTGRHKEHGCWWVRRSPLCRFKERKERV